MGTRGNGTTHVGHYLRPTGYGSEPSSDAPSERPDSRAARDLAEELADEVFARLARTYGYRFTRQFGSEDDGTWAAHLYGLSREQVGAGFARLTDRQAITGTPESQLGWPPTAPEFRQLCTHEPGAAERPAPFHRLAQLPAPPPSMSPDVARPYLQALRAAARGAWGGDEQRRHEEPSDES